MIVSTLALMLLATAIPSGGQDVPRASGDFDHSGWDTLLKRYVNPQARVDYRKWKGDGMGDLDAYLRLLAGPWPSNLSPAARKAALINAYNALTVRWVLENYPVKSIWRTSHPFKEPRHFLDGKKVSLDETESILRKMGDPRIHAAVVCASHSCPPLRREAYSAGRLESQLDDNCRAWLASGDLNDFDPARGVAKVSMIFKWYAGDFQQSATPVREFLARFAPAGRGGFLRSEGGKIEYKTYLWGINDTSSLGRGYSQLHFLWDNFRNRF